MKDLLEDTVVVPVAHLDIFSGIDKPGPHVELLIARVPDFSEELILKAAVDPPLDRHALGDGPGKCAEYNPTDEKDGGTGAVDDGRKGPVDERASEVKNGAEGADKLA